jgi:hypothetical protein
MKIIQEILKNGFDETVNKWSLINKYHKDYPDLVQLCYSELDTPKNPTTRECRGLILHKMLLEPVCYPFYRFDDYNDNTKKQMDWDSAIYLEKIDGSIIHLYYWDDKWHAATKTTPDYSPLSDNQSIQELFWKTWNDLNYPMPPLGYTWIFEFKYPNTNFLSRNELSITLLAVRDMETLKEWDYNRVLEYPHYQKPIFQKDFDLTKLNDIDPVLSEGWVAVDLNNYRLKLKSPQWELIKLLRHNWKNDVTKEVEINSYNWPILVNICRYNRHRTFLENPRYQKFSEKIGLIDKYLDRLRLDFSEKMIWLNSIELKEAHLWLKNNPSYSTLFYQSQKGLSLENWLIGLNIKSLVPLLKHYSYE